MSQSMEAPVTLELLDALKTIIAFDANSPEGLHDYPGFSSEGSFQSGALTLALDRARAVVEKAEAALNPPR